MARESCAGDREALLENKNECHWICLAESRTVIRCRYKGALCFPVVQGMWEAAENSGCEPHITVSPKNRVPRLGEMMEGRAGPKAWSQP